MEDNQLQPTKEQHLFDNHYELTQAGAGRRFINYIVDVISFYVVMFLFFYLLAMINYDLFLRLSGAESDGPDLLGTLITILFYGLYMGLVEALFKGRSLGKLLTGTVAVNEDGSRVSGQTALLRGLSRAVPFNAFSALGSPCYPWHDRWTKTYVVEFKDLRQ